MKVQSTFRLIGAGLLSASLAAGCSTSEGDLSASVGSTMAPLLSPAEPIPGEYIVVFEDEVGVQGVNAAVNRLAFASAESRVLSTYQVLPAFSATLGADDLDALRRHPDVKYIEENGRVHANKIEAVDADGLDRIDQVDLPLDGFYDDHDAIGTNVDIYIIDTGIRFTHQEFDGPLRQNRARLGADFVGDGQNGNDCNGHGTHVASIAGGNQFGVADDADLVAVRVLSCSGSGSISGIISGIDFVAQDCSGDCVGNMSLGGGFSQSLNDAVEAAVASGVPFTVSSGASGASSCNFSPASAPSALTVDAMNPTTDQAAPFTNGGACSDLFAPGVGILGAGNGSDSATQILSGTSTSAPHVAGVAAQVFHCNPGASSAEVEAAIKESALVGKVQGNLQGSPNLLLHNNVCGDAPPDFSCSGFCGTFDRNRPCQCDDGCVQFGDCCPDFEDFCQAPDPNSCLDSGACGAQAPGGCFCDAVCEQFGDCCFDGPC